MIAGLFLAFLLLFASSARAQTPTETSVLDQQTLRDLPSSDNLFGILETTQPSVISDRFSESGLNTGSAARLGSFFSSPTETLYRLGNVNITDPTGSGQPLVLPEVSLWQSVQVQTGLMPIDIGAPGLALTLLPARPGTTWVRHASVSDFGSTVPRGHGVPPIEQSQSWHQVSGSASGPILNDADRTPRLLGFFEGSTTRGRQFDRAESSPVEGSIDSGFAELLFKTTASSELQTIGWAQHSEAPFDERIVFGTASGFSTDSSTHVQATWEAGQPVSRRWRVYAGYTVRDRTPHYGVSSGITLDSLTDGPVQNLASLATTRVSRWSAGIETLPPGVDDAGADKRVRVEAGLEAGGAREQSSGFFSGLAGELVNGIPARIWRFSAPDTMSDRHEITATGYAAGHVAVTDRLQLDLGARLELVSGHADGSADTISWQSVLPRADLQWTVSKSWQTRIMAGVGRSAAALPLDWLAVGDPGAPVADVFQWASPQTGLPLGQSMGALVERVGPGTGGDTSFTSIASGLKAPTTDEVGVAIETHLGPALQLRAAGFARRTRNLVALVDAGAPLSAYSIVKVPDPGLDLFGTSDDQLLPFYNRLPSTFGQDRYVLENSTAEDATSKSLEISGRLDTKYLVMFGGATASMAEGSAANQGFGALENDQSELGELLIDPNAAPFARGRLFIDRAYTVKASALGRLPAHVLLSATIRYQDGQPFARLVINPALNQGAEAVRAFPNGDSRFTFTETLDTRLEKGFGQDGQRVALTVDVFNALNMRNEVEEQVVTGPTFRAVTAIQPPRTLHVGLRVSF